MDVDVEEVMWYCAAHGIALAPPDVKLRTQGLVLLAPVSLRPCRVPRQAFRGVEALSHSINHMVDAVARDHDFLMQTLQGCGLLCVSVPVCLCLPSLSFICVCMHVCVCLPVYVYICADIHLYACVSVPACVCLSLC
mgnify:FL=1